MELGVFERSPKHPTLQKPRSGKGLSYEILDPPPSSAVTVLLLAAERRKNLAHGVSRGSGVVFVAGAPAGAKEGCLRVVADFSVAPNGALALNLPWHPRLSPWATFYRCSAANGKDWHIKTAKVEIRGRRRITAALLPPPTQWP